MTASEPTISACVVPFVGEEYLARCLDALVPQIEAAGGEVLVPADASLGDLALVTGRHPAVRVLRMSGRRTPAELRAHAASAARGAIVAILEDHCVPRPDWCSRLIASHDSPHAAVGGTVEKGFPPGRTSDGALNWALYLTDYSRYMNPIAAGPVHTITDTNMSYKRAELLRIADVWRDEFHENVVNDRLRADGRTLWLAPDVVVDEQRSVPLLGALRDRWSFGRLFASTRTVGQPLVRRAVYAAGSLAMPPVLVGRVARNLFTRRRHRLALVRALPALGLLTTAWMTGECVGYLTGRAARGLAPATTRPAGAEAAGA